jgi:hypothetical protein
MISPKLMISAHARTHIRHVEITPGQAASPSSLFLHLMLDAQIAELSLEVVARCDLAVGSRYM